MYNVHCTYVCRILSGSELTNSTKFSVPSPTEHFLRDVIYIIYRDVEIFYQIFRICILKFRSGSNSTPNNLTAGISELEVISF